MAVRKASSLTGGGDRGANEATATPVRLEEGLWLIRSTFRKVPDLRVTLTEAADLWALDQMKLEIILETFVEVGFLCRSPDGAYARRLPHG